jgi:hypothetical protein
VQDSIREIIQEDEERVPDRGLVPDQVEAIETFIADAVNLNKFEGHTYHSEPKGSVPPLR